MAIEQVEQSPIIYTPSIAAPLTPEAAAEGKTTLTVFIEKQFRLNVEHGVSVEYTSGLHEVPTAWYESYKWVFEGNDAKVHTKVVAAKKAN